MLRVVGESFAQLLRNPESSRMSRDIEMQDTAATVFDGRKQEHRQERIGVGMTLWPAMDPAWTNSTSACKSSSTGAS